MSLFSIKIIKFLLKITLIVLYFGMNFNVLRFYERRKHTNKRKMSLYSIIRNY